MVKQRVGIETTIFIGTGYDGNDARITQGERDGIRRKILAKAARTFRGVTIVDADGAWTNDDGKVVEETVLQVIVYYSRRSRVESDLQLLEFLRYVLDVSRQTSVLVDDKADPGAYLMSHETPGADHA